jgi:hypothetical protein
MNHNRNRLPMVAAVCLALAGCSSQDVPQQAASGLRSKIGYVCTVQFRRDALGAAATNPVPPETDIFNGAQVSLSGKLIDVKGDWLVIGGPTETWVPTHSVLLLKWSREPLK